MTKLNLTNVFALERLLLELLPIIIALERK